MQGLVPMNGTGQRHTRLLELSLVLSVLRPETGARPTLSQSSSLLCCCILCCFRSVRLSTSLRADDRATPPTEPLNHPGNPP